MITEPELDLGWSDLVGKLECLESAVRTLAEGRLEMRDRLDHVAFDMFISLDPDQFPKSLRGRVRAVFEATKTVRSSVSGRFHFYKMKPNDRKKLVANILAVPRISAQSCA